MNEVKISRISTLSFYSSLLLIIYIFFMFLSVYFGNNPLNKADSNKSKFISVFPQGWAFFTTSSKKPRYYVFDQNIKMIETRSFSSEYYYGISRHNRFLNIEITNIFHTIIKDSISGVTYTAADIDKVAKKIKDNKFKFTEVRIDKKFASNFEGRYFFVTQQMLPWPLLSKKPDYPSRYIIYAINVNHK